MKKIALATVFMIGSFIGVMSTDEPAQACSISRPDECFDVNVRSTKFHVDNHLPYPVRVRAIRDGRDEMWQTLQPGGSFQGLIDRRAGVRIVVYGPEDCGDEEIMPSAYARVYTTETFRIRPDGIRRVNADEVDPWSCVAGAALTGIALYYAPEYGPQILSQIGVNEAELAACITDFASVGCATGVVTYAQNVQEIYGDRSVASNQCLQTAKARARAKLEGTGSEGRHVAQTALGFYKQQDRPEVYLVYSSGFYCHVQNEDQMSAFGGFGQVQIVQNLNLAGTNTGDCGWPNGFFKLSDRPEVYRMYGQGIPEFNVGNSFCHVVSPSQMESFGGFGQVQVVASGSDLGRGRSFTNSCD